MSPSAQYGVLTWLSAAAHMVLGVALHLHCASRTDLLVDELAGLLARPSADPFAEEVVVVPARGVERWVTQRLSHRLGTTQGDDGVCAGVRFLSPASLISLLLGRERDDPWHPDRLVWPVLATIDDHLDEPWAQPLAHHLGRDDAQPATGRRYSLARRLAGLFAAYGHQRPQVLTDWRAGRDLDGAGRALAEDLLWQPPLWRKVVERVPAPPPDQRLRETLGRLRDGDPALDLPARISLFGHTRLSRSDAELLAALGSRRDVHLWLPQPSPALWDTTANLAEQGPIRRADDDSAERVDNLLLASLGRDARELRRTLGPSDASPAREPDHAGQTTLLGWLQHDLRSNHQPTADDQKHRPVKHDDRSLQVHACHGPARQVEVLREVLVGLLQDDSTLEPRDVLVMCPDIETYAPLVQATFGLHDVDLAAPGQPRRAGHPGHDLRVRLADRALTSTNPLLELTSRLVGLAASRVTASEVLDLAALPPVRRRFGLDDDALDTFAGWVEQAAVRWGIDEQHRAEFELGWLRDNTWAFGLDRLLLGVTRADGPQHGVGEVLPVDDVGSTAIDLVGSLAELVDRLAATITRLTGAQSAAAWVETLSDAVRGLADVPIDDGWQVAQLERELGGVVEAAHPDTLLHLADVRRMLERGLGGRPTRSNFRTGTLTVCTMTPMRSVPHRVVCLLGLDDGVFPRLSGVDGDDVLARDPITGERDRRSEDRQLLLDAVLAATDHLVVTYSGADEHTGEQRPPAVPIGELIDAAEQTVTPPERRSLVTRHPLQPHDSRNLVAGALGTPHPFSFDPAAVEGARAAVAPTRPSTLLIERPLAPKPATDLALADLIRFFDNPARGFLRDRLDVTVVREEQEPEDAVPVEIERGLGTWAVGDRMLRDALAGIPLPEVLDRELHRGLLPPKTLGDQTLAEVKPAVAALKFAADELRVGEGRTVDLRLDLGGDRMLTGTVGPVFDTGHVEVTYSSVRAKQLLRAWVATLSLSVAEIGDLDETSRVARIVGKSRDGAETHAFGPIDPERAKTWLTELVDVYDRGLREPLPFAPKTSLVAAKVLVHGSGTDNAAIARARGEWEGQPGSSIPGENADPAAAWVFGSGSPVSVLTGTTLGDEAWSKSTTRLGQYATRVFGPMLTHGKT